MKKTGVPYEIQEGKLYMSPVAWPQKCMCCGGEANGGTHDVEHKARYASSTSGSTTTSSYYPLAWKVPYCERCKTHASLVTNLMVIIIFLAILLPIVLAIVLGAVSDSLVVFLLIVGAVVLGVISYRVLLRVLVFPKMTKSCAHYGNAIFASDDTKRVYFHFYNDTVAKSFAQINQTTLEDAEKPNFWRLKK